MNDLSPSFETLGRDLHGGVARLIERRRRRVRRVRVAALAGAAAVVFAAAAVASGIGPDLQLDPTKWSILSSGSVDNGKGKFVNAQDKQTGGRSSFFVQHDAGMDPYDAFLLHQKNQAAAGAAGGIVLHEDGPTCSRDQLTRAESVALQTLRSQYPAGAAPNTTKAAVDDAVRAAFGSSPCAGLEYGGERARFVYAGIEPKSNLMPGAR